MEHTTGTRGLVHLTEHESDLGVTLEVDDTSLDHFVVKIVTLASTLADTTENGETTMRLGDVVNELLNQHGLSDTGTSEQANLSTTSVGSEEIDDLDTSLEHLGGGRLLNERRGIGVDRAALGAFDGAALIDGFTDDVHDAAKGCDTDGDGNGSTSIDDLLATDETLGTVHGNGTDRVFTQMRGNLENEPTTMEVLDFERVQNRREVLAVKLDIDDGTDNSLDRSDSLLSLGSIGAGWIVVVGSFRAGDREINNRTSTRRRIYEYESINTASSK
jgi:hypothetical protein